MVETESLYRIADKAAVLRNAGRADHDYVLRILFKSDIPGALGAAAYFSWSYVDLKKADHLVSWLIYNETEPGDEDELEPEVPEVRTVQFKRMLDAANVEREAARRHFADAVTNVALIGDALIAAHPGSERIIVDQSPA